MAASSTGKDSTFTISCGIDLGTCGDIAAELRTNTQQGFAFICVPLAEPCPPNDKEKLIVTPDRRLLPLTHNDLDLSSREWSVYIVGKTSSSLDLDSADASIREDSEKSLRMELEFSSHLNLPAILIELKSIECVNLARCIAQHLASSISKHLIWVKVPICGSSSTSEKADTKLQAQAQTPWYWWHRLASVISVTSPATVGVVAELTEAIPSETEIVRWFSEPLKAIFIPTHIFLTNPKGFPVLSKAHQAVLGRLFEMKNLQYIITGECLHGDKGLSSYRLYLEHLWKTQRDTSGDQLSRIARGYEDYLQWPLQPLSDNLASETYEIFEKDATKYAYYQQAVAKVLTDKKAAHLRAQTAALTNVSESNSSGTVSTSSNPGKGSSDEEFFVAVMVLGAGRGPLVDAVLNASRSVNCPVRVLAVEKNAYAVNTLRNLARTRWSQQPVTVLAGDMRSIDFASCPTLPIRHADLLVSELLGSFGDNELSPECLDGAEKQLRTATNGVGVSVSVPSHYASYLAPLQSRCLHSKLFETRFEPEKPLDASFETPYVVHLVHHRLLDEPRELFVFEHPNNEQKSNKRYAELRFEANHDGVLHGFAGYFTSRLYDDVYLSTNPITHTPGLFSWFPIFFPIRVPIEVRKGDPIAVRFWRCVSERDVWYEWCVVEPQMSQMHNANGRCYKIGL